MIVKEALAELQQLVDEGHGDVVLMCSDGQGNTEEGSVYATVSEVTGTEMGGAILDMEVGTKYVALHSG